jgi:hypothetical protein
MKGKSMIKLIEKKDMIVDSVKDQYYDKDDGIKHRYKVSSLYKEAILGYVEKWKSEIEKSPDGQITVRIRHIRDNILGKGFENKNDFNIYSRLRLIVLEYGIRVVLKHHYGANLLMFLAKEEDIMSDKERTRISCEQTAIRTGYLTYGDYSKNRKSNRDKHVACDVDLNCTRYLGTFVEEKLMKIFDGASKNPIRGLGSGYWDWKCNNDMLIKYVAASLCYRIKIDNLSGKEYEWKGFHWAILRNDAPDFFLLVGYGESREDLDIENAWLVPCSDIIRTKKFWDRESFTIRCDKKKQLLEMKKYEVGKDRLEKMREIIGQQNKTITIDITMREEISAWYRTYFR